MKFKVDTADFMRRMRRLHDTNYNFTYRRLFFLLLAVAVILLYLGPTIFRWLFGAPEIPKDPLLHCMDDRLTPFYVPSMEFNANIRHSPPFPHERNIIPYVGNGYFGLEIQEDAHLNIKTGRSLSLPVYFHPIVSLSSKNGINQEATAVDYLSGTVHRFQCFEDGYFVTYKYYAHRTMPHVFVQEIQVTNTKNQLIDVELVLPRISDWPTAVSQIQRLQHGSNIIEYQAVTGLVELSDSRGQAVTVSVVSRFIPRTLTLKKRGITKLELLSTVVYSDPISLDMYLKAQVKDKTEKAAIEAMDRALQEAVHNSGANYNEFHWRHVRAWNSLWATGFEISTSKAENSLNGDRINATMYAVLSQARSFEFEENVSAQRRSEISNLLATEAEGCFDSHHTLQAETLWSDMSTLEELNTVTSSWMLTLEKQGCHDLIRAGASGLIQAMVLSFGGFRFSNQHLEMNIHPKYLHREYNFRRLNYGNMTHVNVSVSVKDDNKAVLYVALDRSDRNYYACDAGCLDDPVPLSQARRRFPVKLTEPITAILYITSDRQHIEELHHAIHVKEVAEAPAHEHHVIALHKHGHHLAGLPKIFWISVCVLIVVFHIFLCKLIVKEYCEPPDKMRYRYSKP
ncbi:uncharacterized protein KIAA2013 homolog [Lutzomyia longipalpis]|uniref:Putative conserved plasma membrane protein n=1 Tax=Lutzomyia longipalpis TaxID=7200 RepID=A0A7G3AGX0_LUTLO|nr:uncharacterized protein KIAA2013 homolog [Lutzomyia longipalpis]